MIWYVVTLWTKGISLIWRVCGATAAVNLKKGGAGLDREYTSGIKNHKKSMEGWMKLLSETEEGDGQADKNTERGGKHLEEY